MVETETERTPLLTYNGEGGGGTEGAAARRRPLLLSVSVAFTGFMSAWAFWAFYVDQPIPLMTGGFPSDWQAYSNDYAFFLTSTLWVLFVSVYSPRLGKRRLLLFSLTLILLGSVLASSARSIEWLIVGRLAQSLGTPPVWSLSIGILADSHSLGSGTRGKAIGGYAYASALGCASAPFMSYFVNKISPIFVSLPPDAAWRVTQGLLAGGLIGALGAIYLFVPPREETISTPIIEQQQVHTSTAAQEPESEEQVANDGSGIRISRSFLANPFAGLTVLFSSKEAGVLSFASGVPVYSTITALGAEICYLVMPYPRLIEIYLVRRFLPAFTLGMAAGALISGIRWDRETFKLSAATLIPTPNSNEIEDDRMLARNHTDTALNLNVDDKCRRRLRIAIPSVLLLSVTTIVMGILIDSAMYNPTTDERWGVHPVTYCGMLLGTFVVGYAAYSVLVPSILYILEVTPPQNNAEVLAANDALQLLLTFIVFMCYSVRFSGYRQDGLYGVAAVVTLGSSLLLYIAIHWSKFAARIEDIKQGVSIDIKIRLGPNNSDENAPSASRGEV